MKKLAFISTCFFLLFSSLFSYSQNDNRESRTFQTGDFRSVYLEGGFRVYLVQGKENSLTVRATDSEAIDYLNIGRGNDSLSLKVERDHFNFDRISLYITFKELENIRIQGGVRLKTTGYIEVHDLNVLVEGGARIDLNVKAEEINISGEGGMLFELNGVAERLNVKVSGAGHVDADELNTRNVTFKVEGVGTGSVYATETLNAHIEGVGKLRYRGNPIVTRNIEGVGSIKGSTD